MMDTQQDQFMAALNRVLGSIPVHTDYDIVLTSRTTRRSFRFSSPNRRLSVTEIDDRPVYPRITTPLLDDPCYASKARVMITDDEVWARLCAEGEFGVLEGHAPFMSTIRDGAVQVYKTEGGEPETIQVEGGFAEVGENGLTVLAEKVAA